MLQTEAYLYDCKLWLQTFIVRATDALCKYKIMPSSVAFFGECRGPACHEKALSLVCPERQWEQRLGKFCTFENRTIPRIFWPWESPSWSSWWDLVMIDILKAFLLFLLGGFLLTAFLLFMLANTATGN